MIESSEIPDHGRNRPVQANVEHVAARLARDRQQPFLPHVDFP
jgi:hypothetical protein